MATLNNFWAVFLLLILSTSADASGCTNKGFPVVRNIGELPQDYYGRKGLSHVTVAGSVFHGLKEGGTCTPIHRHSCEEVFVILKGSGTLYPAPDVHRKYPGLPQVYSIFSNSTFTIPVNDAHQIWNTNQHEDLQVLVVILRQPIKVWEVVSPVLTYSCADNSFIYETGPRVDLYSTSRRKFPYYWDEECLGATLDKDEL